MPRQLRIEYPGAIYHVMNRGDRRGRQTTATANGATTTRTLNDAGLLLSESFSGGTLNGLAVTNGYDSLLRRSAVGLNTQPSTLTQFGYDGASRLQNVTNGSARATYSYLANSPLVENIVFRQNGTTRMTTTKQYDFVNRLTSISSVPSGASVVSSAYAYNSASQRTSVTNLDGSRWVYTNDSMGQVTSGKKYWSDGTPVAGQQFTYGFDDIGNRQTTGVGGDANGQNLRSASYSANLLNQYTSRTVPGYVNVTGTATNTATVTLWSTNSLTPYTPTSRKDEYFRGEMPVNNSTGAVWLTLTNLATLTNASTADVVARVKGNLFLAKTPETFGYDADGNLTNDGRWTLTWDAENRLTKAESLSSSPTASKRKVEWTYDARGRRIRQTTSDGSSGSYVVTEDLKFISDGWRHIAELNATNNALVRSYTWGLDLSGSLDAAGGVGGLLMLNSAANGVHFFAYDGNGNVAALVKASDGTVSANYEYEPFGVTLRATGSMAKENPFRFSTKRTDNTTDFMLYEYRPYIPSLGRWPSHDPIGEQAFRMLTLKRRLPARDQEKNLYCLLSNNSIGDVDVLGLAKLSVGICEVIVFYGHGTQGKPHEFDSSGPCCAGHFIGCYDAETNDKIPKRNKIPGAPSTYDDLSLNPYDGDGKVCPFCRDFEQAWSAALDRAKQKCKICSCLCPSFKVKAVFVPSNLMDDSYIPDEQGAHPAVKVDCSKVK